MAKKYKAIYVDPSTKERLSICYCLGHAICDEAHGTIYEIGEDIEEPDDALFDIKNYIEQWSCKYRHGDKLGYIYEHPEILDDPKYQWLKIENWLVEEIEDER